MGQEDSRIYWTESWQNIVQDQGNIPCQKGRNPDQNWCKLFTVFSPELRGNKIYRFLYLNITSIVELKLLGVIFCSAHALYMYVLVCILRHKNVYC